ncbi:MAG: hypothetical protein HY421_02300 [Candidatus Kerfeldbacteria bacterium]|nr:hypothetical protein [Candidatus Kerfeldbacteria bacterium]
MKKHLHFRRILVGLVVLATFGATTAAYATHRWGNYHWARTANPFTLKLGDNLTSTWDSYLVTTSNDWSQSSVLDTTIVAGGSRTARRCNPTTGRVEVCNYRYGYNGWLGVAQIWINGDHITQGAVKLNDTYFNTATYNTPAWRNLVMCQEVGHTFGLGHQDENFYNLPLGTCMDYSNDPTPNQHPNQHDYDLLEEIYAHLDLTTTVNQSAPLRGAFLDLDNPAEWGQELRTSIEDRTSIYLRDLGHGEKVLTHVFWVQ